MKRRAASFCCGPINSMLSCCNSPPSPWLTPHRPLWPIYCLTSLQAALRPAPPARSKPTTPGSRQIIRAAATGEALAPAAAKMKVVEVDLGDRSYPIYIGAEIFLPPHRLPCLHPLLISCFTETPSPPLPRLSCRYPSPLPAHGWVRLLPITVDGATLRSSSNKGAGIMDEPGLLRQHIPGKSVLIVTNETIAPLYLERQCRCPSLSLSRTPPPA